MPAMILVKAKLQSPMQRSLFLLFFLTAFCSHSQISTSFFIDGVFDRKQVFKDSLDLMDQIQDHKLDAISRGYYFAGVDSIQEKENEWFIYLHRGEKMKLELVGYKGKNVITSLKKRINYLSDNGYPFAFIQIDSTLIEGDILKGKITEEKGPYITNDSSFFYTEIKTDPRYVHYLLEHVIGEPFKESNYQKINDRLSRSSFLSFKRPVDISFQNEKAKLYLDLEERDASSFEGILGLQQQGSGKSTVVGGLNLNVENLFRSGKELGINWESFANESQELALSYSHPFFLGSKLKPYFRFDLLKQDSTFLKRSTKIDIGVYVSSDLEIRVGYNRNTGSLLSTEVTTLLNSDIADYNSDIYSLRLNKGRISDVNELASNHSWTIGVSLGSKEIDNNLSLPDTFYDTLDLKTNVFHFDLKAVLNQKIFKRQQLAQQVEIGLIENDELLNNERYRLGGLKSVRGFNEKSFFTDRYLMSRTELRTFFEKGSYLYLFYDQLFFRNDDFMDAPSGTGLGFSLATLSGQFNFAIALGQSKGQRMEFSNMKVHFGYITSF